MPWWNPFGKKKENNDIVNLSTVSNPTFVKENKYEDLAAVARAAEARAEAAAAAAASRDRAQQEYDAAAAITPEQQRRIINERRRARGDDPMPNVPGDESGYADPSLAGGAAAAAGPASPGGSSLSSYDEPTLVNVGGVERPRAEVVYGRPRNPDDGRE